MVVAASPRYASRLQPTLAAAEQAAAKADRYARWRPQPSRYVVYLAGAGRVVDVVRRASSRPGRPGTRCRSRPSTREIVLNASRIDSGEVLNTLTHEFSHVTTLAGVQRNYTDSWLLVEGLAEYVTHGDRSRAGAYPWLDGTRRYVDSGRWPGTAALAAPAESATVSDATGRYGVAYFAVRRLAERFGRGQVAGVLRRRGPRRPAAGAGVPGDRSACRGPTVAADCDRLHPRPS